MSLSSELAAAIETPDLKVSSMLSVLDKNELINENKITLSQRMISACSGSLITSLVVTPFDVIRIRIQQQELLPKDQICCGGSKPNSGTGVFWTKDEFCKSSASCSRVSSISQGFVSISRNEGIATLWRGLSLTLVMAVPANIIYFTGYEYIRDHSPLKGSFINPLICGASARVLAATFVSPIELIKTRLQSIPSDVSSNNPKLLSNLLKDSYNLVQTKGVSTLFKGLQITLWRDVPFSGIYWSAYEGCKHLLSSLNSLKPDPAHPDRDSAKVFTTSFLSGSISGTIAALCTNPFDVGKTRLQIASEPDSTRNTLIKKPKKTSMFRFLLTIYKKEGLRALYAGITPRVMKIAPSCAIMISSYEIGKKFFNDN